MMKKLIGYRRVSTQRQGVSGLGLDAQDYAITQYAGLTQGDLVRSYTEIETGTKDEMENRPELLKAIAHSRRAGARLVIAKLDRLARSVYVTATLHKTGVDFICCDNPGANRMTIQILAVMAESEGKMISQRVKDALRAYKDGKRVSRRVQEEYAKLGIDVPQEVIDATAGKLGAHLTQCRNLTPEARALGARAAGEVHRRKAIERYSDLIGHMKQMRKSGSTLQAIADELNGQGHLTGRQKPWSHVQVKRILDRASR